MTASAGGNILSQDEIDALLKQSDSVSSESGNGGGISADDCQKLAVFYGKSVDAVATVLNTFVSKSVDLGVPQVATIGRDDVPGLISGLKVVMSAAYQEGLPGQFVLITSEEVAGVLASLMMGEEGRKPDELTELYLSGLVEVTNQMLGSMTNTMAGQLQGMTVVTGIPQVEVSDLSAADKYPVLGQATAVKISYKIDIGGLVSGELIQLDTIEQAQKILERIKGAAPKAAPAAGAPARAAAPAGGGAAPAARGAAGNVNVQPVQFAAFNQQPAPHTPSNLDLLVDVPMRVTVELGRTRMRIKEILNLGGGSIIELDKLAGEPVDLLVNGKLIAKGEVVVIDENFGVRVTEIVPPAERFNEML